MPRPFKVMIVEEAGARAPVRERLLEEYQLDFQTRRVGSEAELRALSREFAPDITLGTDDLPASPQAEGELIRLLSRQAPRVLICEVSDGHAVPWEPRAASRRASAMAAAPPHDKHKIGDGFASVQGLPGFFEDNLDAVVIVDSEGWIGYANASACTLLARQLEGPMGTSLANAPGRSRGVWEDHPSSANVIKLQMRQPRPVQGLVVFESTGEVEVAAPVHLEDLVHAKAARSRDQSSCLPLVALELSGLQLLHENYGRSVCNEIFSVISSVVQPQYARCGLIASLGRGEHLVVLPYASEAADAAVAVQGRKARAQQYDLTDEFALYDESPANDPPVLREIIKAAPRAMSHATTQTINPLATPPRRAINVHYQPQYDADSGEAIGAEALARWTLSNGETLMPAEFLPIAERMGMLGRVEAVVLEEVCALGSRLSRREAERLTLAVNVTASQICEEFTQILATSLERSPFAMRRLELEIDEAVLSGAAETTVERLREWRRLGVRIAANHHSCSYASLGYLSHLEVDRIKLDRSLIERITAQRSVATFVHAVVSLGAELEVDVMAQGVETTAQLKLLRDMGCSHVQGFLFARPMPADEAQLALQRSFGYLPPEAWQGGAPLALAH